MPYEQMGNSSIGGQGQGQGQMMASRSMPLGVDGSGSEPGSGPGPGYERRGSYSGIPDSRSGYDPSGRAGPGVGSGSRPGFGQSRAPPSSWGRSDLAMGDRSYSEYGQHAGTLDTPSPGYRGSSYGKDAEDDTERTPRKNRVSSGTFKQDGGILGRLTFESELELSQDGSPGRLFMEGVGTGGDSGPYRDRIHEGGSPRSLASSVRPSKAASPTHSPSYAVPSPERRGRQIAPPRLSLSTDPAVPLQRVNATQPEAIQGGEVENLISPKKEKEKEKKFWQGRRSSRRMSTTSILSDRVSEPGFIVSGISRELTTYSPARQHHENPHPHTFQQSLLPPHHLNSRLTFPLPHRIARRSAALPLSYTTHSTAPAQGWQHRTTSMLLSQAMTRHSALRRSDTFQAFQNRKFTNGKDSFSHLRTLTSIMLAKLPTWSQSRPAL